VIFSRKGGNAGRHTADAKGRPGGGAAEPAVADDEFADAADFSDAESADDADETPSAAEYGPYDLADAPDDGVERLDLGALRIPAIAGVEFQLQAAEDGQIQQVMLVHNESRLQLGVFAAPKTEGIWDDVRAMLRTSMAQNGARQEDATGDYGPELKARLRDGASTVDLRHVGIDGPRWFVHAVFIGAAAADPGQAGPLLQVLRGVVVDRGTDARPVREALPLRLPPQATAQLAAQAAADEADAQPSTDAKPAAATKATKAATTGARGAAGAKATAKADAPQPAPTGRATGRTGATRGNSGRGASRQA